MWYFKLQVSFRQQQHESFLRWNSKVIGHFMHKESVRQVTVLFKRVHMLLRYLYTVALNLELVHRCREYRRDGKNSYSARKAEDTYDL